MAIASAFSRITMQEFPTSPASHLPLPRKRSLRRRLARFSAIVLVVYVAAAYLLIPGVWTQYYKDRPVLDSVPGVTRTSSGIPADPINVALVGTEPEVQEILLAAGWHPADPLSFTSDVRIAADTVLRRPYLDAPVSSLFLFGRREDLAFEKPMGGSPQRRNHVRFWKSDNPSGDGRPLWVGAATYDRSVGLSHTTGQITHHIAPDIDAERDALFRDLIETKQLSETYVERGFHEVRHGRNGGGDPWWTDGDLRVGVIGRLNSRLMSAARR